MCVEMYRQGKWPETPEGVSTDRFHHAVVEWHRLEKACGAEVLRHKKQNKVWTAEEKYELVAKVLAGASCMETAIAAGILLTTYSFEFEQKEKEIINDSDYPASISAVS